MTGDNLANELARFIPRIQPVVKNAHDTVVRTLKEKKKMTEGETNRQHFLFLNNQIKVFQYLQFILMIFDL